MVCLRATSTPRLNCTPSAPFRSPPSLTLSSSLLQGVGSVVAAEFFARAQREPTTHLGGGTALERGATLAYLATLSSPLPLLAAAGSAPAGLGKLRVPTDAVRQRHPRLRGSWVNFHHKGDPVGFALQPFFPAVAQDHALSGRAKRETPLAIASLHDVAGFVRPVAQALSWVWQDTNWRD